LLRHFQVAVFSTDHAPPTLTGSCGPQPGLACRLVWNVSHNGRAAQLTNDFLAGPVHLLLRVLFVVVLALVIRAVLHHVIKRLTERASRGVLPQFRNGAVSARIALGRQRRRERVRERGGSRGSVLDQDAAEPTAELVAANSGVTRAGEPSVAETAADAANVEHALVDERRRQRVHALGSILRSASSITVFAIAGAVVLGDLGINLAPLLASAGVVGIAIGFGAQNLVRDYLSGIFMLLEDQYGVGDVITVGDASGTVETVTLRLTRLRDVNGIVWHVRNGAIEKVGNESQGWARAVIDYPVPYEADLSTIREILSNTADAMWTEPAWRAVMLDAPEVWGAQELTGTEVTMRLVVKTAPLQQWGVEREMRARVKAALDAADIAPSS
jgi:moderate conductance mechanosensitive channel